MPVIELRNYLLRDGATGDFRRYFEEHFLFSQREEGMHVLGQFEVVSEPNRFVWVRGFESMETRRRGLEGFYGGPFWEAHRSAANAMMLEHHDVHLLRPLGSVTALTGGLSLEDRAAEPAGAVLPDAGLVAVDFYRARPGALDCVTRLVTQRRPSSRRVLGHFVAELTPNDYPRLPVTQDADLLVVVSAYAGCRHYEEIRAGESPVAAGAIRGFLAGDVSTVLLRPTARSLIRYRSSSPEER